MFYYDTQIKVELRSLPVTVSRKLLGFDSSNLIVLILHLGSPKPTAFSGLWQI